MIFDRNPLEDPEAVLAGKTVIKDGAVIQKDDGSLYFVWSGWPGTTDGQQNLYIAPMSNPYTISGERS